MWKTPCLCMYSVPTSVLRPESTSSQQPQRPNLLSTRTSTPLPVNFLHLYPTTPICLWSTLAPDPTAPKVDLMRKPSTSTLCQPQATLRSDIPATPKLQYSGTMSYSHMQDHRGGQQWQTNTRSMYQGPLTPTKGWHGFHGSRLGDWSFADLGEFKAECQDVVV